MANDILRLELGPIEAVLTPPQSYSRYRSLRGKSVSSPCDFDMFGDGDNIPKSDSKYSDLGQINTSSSIRSRCKSVLSYCSAPKSRATRPVMPPLPKDLLSPRSANISAPSSLGVLESIQSSTFSSENSAWEWFSKINKSPIRDVGSTDRDCTAVGPQFQKQVDQQQESQEQDGYSDRRGDLVQLQKPESANEPETEKKLKEALDDSTVLDIKQLQPNSNKVTNGLANHLADEIACLEAETDRIIAEQKKWDLARLQEQLVTSPPKPKRRLLNKLVCFSRSKRSAAGGTQPGAPSTIASTIFSPAISYFSRDSSVKEPPTPDLINSGNSSARASTDAEQNGDEPLNNVDTFRMSQTVVTPEEVKARRLASVKSNSSIHRSGTVKENGSAPVEVPEIVRASEPEFVASSLLGNPYKLKQSDAAEAASSTAASDGPFTEARSPLNGGIPNFSSDTSDQVKKQADEEKKKPEAKSWFPSAVEHSARLRSQLLHSQPPYQQRRPVTADTAATAPLTRSERHPAPLLSFWKGVPESLRFRKAQPVLDKYLATH